MKFWQYFKDKAYDMLIFLANLFIVNLIFIVVFILFPFALLALTGV